VFRHLTSGFIVIFAFWLLGRGVRYFVEDSATRVILEAVESVVIVVLFGVLGWKLVKEFLHAKGHDSGTNSVLAF
jgi:hypothetical protein